MIAERTLIVALPAIQHQRLISGYQRSITSTYRVCLCWYFWDRFARVHRSSTTFTGRNTGRNVVALPLPKPYKKIAREELPPGECLCDYCTAKCCKYFALPLETPTTREDFDYLRWYLLHDAATVFVEEGTWYLLVHTACKHLAADNRCRIYETRPQICRDYSTHNCEYEDSWVYDHYFETAEQVEEYVEAVLPSENGNVRSQRPELLPVL
jgi:Fe-S-cluster containining protein